MGSEMCIRDSHYAYVIEPAEDDHAAEVVEEPAIPMADMMASADMATGEILFQRQCSACHSIEDGGRGVGPHLYGVVDRTVGSVDGFGYSGSLVAVAEVWDLDALSGFITSPRDYAPGTAMGYGGMDDAEDRASLIAYLDSLDE